MNFDLQKETAKVKFTLEKKAVPQIIAQVGFDIDVSGSIQGLFNNGTVQKVTERIMPVALNFDDNGELDAWVFSRGSAFAQITTATSANLDGFVKKEILQNRNLNLWGGTSYSPVLRANLEYYGFIQQTSGGIFKKATTTFVKNSKSGYPVIIYFVTDGENDDEDQRPTQELLKAAEGAGCNVYFMFIGIGRNGNFSFLEKIADDYGNTGFLAIRDIESAANSDGIYEQLLCEELCSWLRTKK